MNAFLDIFVPGDTNKISRHVMDADSMPNPPASLGEIKAAVWKLKFNGTPGPDEIGAELLKRA